MIFPKTFGLKGGETMPLLLWFQMMWNNSKGRLCLADRISNEVIKQQGKTWCEQHLPPRSISLPQGNFFVADAAYINEESFGIKELTRDLEILASKMDKGQVFRGLLLINEKANPKIKWHNTSEEGIHTVNLVNMILDDENKLVKKIKTHNAPYSPIKLSTMDGRKHKTTSSLLDTGADIPVISHKIAL